MDGHSLIAHVAFCSTLGDGGPRHYRRRGKPLPEKYLPGRCLMGMPVEDRALIVRALDNTPPAPWFIRVVVCGVEPQTALPPPPIDRRWSCRGRWSTPRATRR